MNFFKTHRLLTNTVRVLMIIAFLRISVGAVNTIGNISLWELFLEIKAYYVIPSLIVIVFLFYNLILRDSKHSAFLNSLISVSILVVVTMLLFMFFNWLPNPIYDALSRI